MNIEWTIREGNPGVAVFVLGWAADSKIVGHIKPEGCDVVCVSDYRASQLGGAGSYTERLAAAAADLRDELQRYSARYLFAWSFGVWVAEQIFGGGDFDRAVALNGTPHPVDALYGIEPRRMAITIRGLAAGGMEAFNRRTYGELYESFADKLSPRPLEANTEELRDLADGSQGTVGAPYSAGTSLLGWHKAVVGEQDAIFPPENLRRYWGVVAEVLPLPHYPFGDADMIYNEIGNR